MLLVSDYHKGQKRSIAWLYQTDFIVVMRGGVFLFSSFFSASPTFKVLSRTTNETLQGNKKSVASNAFSGKEQNEVRDVQFIRCHFNPLGKKSISSLFISQDTKNSNPLLL